VEKLPDGLNWLRQHSRLIVQFALQRTFDRAKWKPTADQSQSHPDVDDNDPMHRETRQEGRWSFFVVILWSEESS
jgi:hypothetical protein